MITKAAVNFTVTKRLSITAMHYLIADIISECYKQDEPCSTERIYSLLLVSKDSTDKAIQKLVELGYIHQNGKRFYPSELWLTETRDADAIVKKDEKAKFRERCTVLTEEVITYYNLINGTRKKPKTYEKLIARLLREDKKLESIHFEFVIEDKKADWGNDPKMEQYNRPETLFGNKFFIYLDQARTNLDKKTRQNKLSNFQ
jgi:uncharacterized phage protein (TIGR02220 family)